MIGHLYFVRHGQSTCNEAHVYAGQTHDVQLTTKGRAQAVEAAGVIKPWNVNVIISSDLDRACETAGLIADGIGEDRACIETDIRLREVDCGRMTGQPEHGFVEYLKYARSGVDPTAETMEVVCDRLRPLLRTLARRDEPNILIVAHAGIGRALQALLTGRTIDELAVESVGNAAPFELPIDRLKEI